MVSGVRWAAFIFANNAVIQVTVLACPGLKLRAIFAYQFCAAPLGMSQRMRRKLGKSFLVVTIGPCPTVSQSPTPRFPRSLNA